MSGATATSFFETWQTYQKVVAANYMYHSEITADIERLFRTQLGTRQFSLLDLAAAMRRRSRPFCRAWRLRIIKRRSLGSCARPRG